MKSITKFVGLQLGSIWFLFSFCPSTAEAHNPGLSTAAITVEERWIDVVLGYARQDVNLLLDTCGGQAETSIEEGFEAIRTRLESRAAREVNLFLQGIQVSPSQSTARLKDSQNIEILLRFQGTGATQLRLVSNLFERLPLGHREFVLAKTVTGIRLGEAILSEKENAFQIELPTIISPAFSAPVNRSFFAFLMLGMEHILTGYDHLLFLFGLLVVCRNLRSILTVITCFTIAHSITLALSVLNIVRLPPVIVEPLIAASIAYVGIENLIRGDAPRWRGLITFAFGLIHGLGFADALKQFGIGSDQFGIVLPLVGFNLGVELGQFLIAAVVLPVLWWLRRKLFFVRQWVPLCSAAVTLAGSYWLMERIMQ
jgi:hydrogenase/urease accessory protein HupE